MAAAGVHKVRPGSPQVSPARARPRVIPPTLVGQRNNSLCQVVFY